MAWKDKQNAVEELTRKMNENIKNFQKDPKQELELFLTFVSFDGNSRIDYLSHILEVVPKYKEKFTKGSVIKCQSESV